MKGINVFSINYFLRHTKTSVLFTKTLKVLGATYLEWPHAKYLVEWSLG